MADIGLLAVLPKINDPDLEYRKYLNFLVALRQRRRNAPVVSSRPFDVTTDMSTACHLHCPYCATGNKTLERAPMHLTLAVHDDMLNKFGDTLFVVWYFSNGEPLLNPHLPELIAQTKGKEIFSSISTNLSMPLSDERLDAIVQSGLSLITASIDGACQETYSRYRRGGDFELATNNLRRMARRKRELGLRWPLLEWRFLIFRHNQHETAAVRRMAKEIGVDALEFLYGHAPDNSPADSVQRSNQALEGPCESGPALRQALARRDTRLRRRLGRRICKSAGPYPPEMLRKKCDWLYYSSMIYPNGRVGPCCVTGNERDDFGSLDPAEPFGSLWNNQRYQSARSLYNGGTSSDLPCTRCGAPLSMDLQFVKSVNGILANAPDWVVATIAAEPDAFFYEIDCASMPCAAELRRIDATRLGPFPEIAARLRNDANGDSAWQEDVDGILDLVTRPKIKSWWDRVLCRA